MEELIGDVVVAVDVHVAGALRGGQRHEPEGDRFQRVRLDLDDRVGMRLRAPRLMVISSSVTPTAKVPAGNRISTVAGCVPPAGLNAFFSASMAASQPTRTPWG